MKTREDDLWSALHSEDQATKLAAIQVACQDKRTDLLPDLIALLADEHLGFFAEEGLPHFGDMVAPHLRPLIHDENAPLVARQRAAGILALFGDASAVPLLLLAIEQTTVNQAYFQRLEQLNPSELAQKVNALLLAYTPEILHTTDPLKASYFAMLIRTLGQLHALSVRSKDLLDIFAESGRDWRIQDAARDTHKVA